MGGDHAFPFTTLLASDLIVPSTSECVCLDSLLFQNGIFSGTYFINFMLSAG